MRIARARTASVGKSQENIYIKVYTLVESKELFLWILPKYLKVEIPKRLGYRKLIGLMLLKCIFFVAVMKSF